MIPLSEIRAKRAKSSERSAKRLEKGLALGLRKAPAANAKAPPRGFRGSNRRLGITGGFKRARKPKAKSRKWLVREADRVFSLFIRARDPFSFFSGKCTEHCFHIISRAKYSVRWDEDNAVGSTAGENFEMEFNSHKFILPIIKARGLAWYEDLVRKSNTIAKLSNDDLRAIIDRYSPSQKQAIICDR